MDNMEDTGKRIDDKSPSVTDVTDTTNLDKDNFRFVDGRRFHNVENSKYPLPNDDKEHERLYMQHLVFKHAWQGNFASPVEHLLNDKGTKVLDIGYVFTMKCSGI